MADLATLVTGPTEGKLIYELAFPIETPSNNTIREMPFYKYKSLRESWCLMVMVALKGRRPTKPLDQAYVVVDRWSSGHLDWDNVYGGLKPVLDCLVVPSKRNPNGLGLISDDSPKHMPYPPLIRQRLTSPGKGKALVQIYELPAPATPSLA